MYYCYILQSPSLHKFYFGFTHDVKVRLSAHNSGFVTATKPRRPWHLVWYCAFNTEREAKDFEKYLKSGSGKAFAYKRLVSVALAKDIGARPTLPKPKA